MSDAKNKNVNENPNPVKADIILLIILAVAVLLFISLIGFCGMIGVGLRFILFGLLGLPAYAFPFLLFFASIYLMANKGNRILVTKSIGLIGLYIFVCALCQIVIKGFDPTYPVFQSFLDCAADHMGGGFFGGCIIQLFGNLIGVIGTYIVLIIGMFIFAILLTQKPLVRKMSDNTKVMYERAKENRARQRERRETERLSTIEEERPKRERRPKKERMPDTEELPMIQDPQIFINGEIEDKFDAYLNSKFNKNNENTNDEGPEVVPFLSNSIIEPPVKGYPEIELPVFEDTEQIYPNEEEEAEAELPLIEPEVYEEDEQYAIEDVFSPEEFNPEENIQNMDAAGVVPIVGIDKDSKKTEVKTEKTDAESVVPKAAVENAKKHIEYRKPPISLLNKGSGMNGKEMSSQIKETAKKLQQTLHNFGVEVTVTGASCGPTVTRYELQPEQGVKVSKIVNLSDDIKLNLAAPDIRIEAPIPGKAAIGIEVPNKTNNVVALRELIDTPEFKNSKSKLSITVGKDLAGKTVISDIAKMPHLLIAGSTGSGKSVCINTFIMSILYKADPDEVKLMMIDPKVVELSIYNGIPHLLVPVVTDAKKAAGALQWAVAEMGRRYNLFAEYSVRDIKGYNAKASELAAFAKDEEVKPEILPQIVIVVDELADLMMVAPGEVEESICRLAQLARAAGLHLIIATQRPSVNVITGLIKANMPSRIALSVTSGIDSRVIIDMNGAEKLLGKGDMLFYPAGYQKPARVQGGFVSDEEIERVVEYISKKETVYDNSIEEAIASSAVQSSSSGGAPATDDRDVYFVDAGKFIIEKDKASIGMLQRVFKIGFNRAARIMDQLCDAGVVGEEEGTKPRKILMSLEQFENYLEEN